MTTINVVLAILATVMVVAGVLFGIVTAKGIRNWGNPDILKAQKIAGIITLLIEIALIAGGIFLLKVNLIQPLAATKSAETYSSEASTESDGAQEAVPEETDLSESEADLSEGDPATADDTETSDATEATEEATASELEANAPRKNTGRSTALILLSIGCFILTLISVFGARRSSKRKLRVALAIIAFIGGVMSLVAAYGMTKTTGNIENGRLLSEDSAGVATEAGESDETDQDATIQLPEGAFAIDFSEDDLLKAMKQRFGEDFAWETYQNNFSDDLFPSRYQERKDRVELAMQKWYSDPNREGFSDPVWFPMDDLINIYHSDEWKNMSKDQKKELLEKIRLQVYDQILRNPRYCEMFVEFFYKLAETFPEIVTRNESWMPAFNEWYGRANDPTNIVKDPDGKDIVAGISVFFEPISNAGDAKILQRGYVTNAARICLMMDEFSFNIKDPVQTPTSEVNWHLAFGKDAATAKVSMITDPEYQEKEPVLILRYKYKSGLAIKAGVNIFDRRLEIFPLKEPENKEEKKEKTPPAKNGTTPKNDPEPGKNPDPGKNPEPNNNPTPEKTEEAPLVVHHQEQGTGKVLQGDHNKSYVVGAKYSYTAPESITKDGKVYKAVSNRVVSGDKMPKGGVEQTVYYKAEGKPTPQTEDYLYTVYYKYKDGGGNVFEPDPSRHKAGDKFAVSAKPKSGYHVEGTTTHDVTMPAHDDSYTFWYVKDKSPEQRPSGGDVSDGPTAKEDDEQQPTKPDKKPYTPVPKQPDKKPDGLPDQKPDAPAGNGNSDEGGNEVPPPTNPDTNATVDGPDGSTTTNTSNDKPAHRVPKPVD